jgi:DNA-binding ferritin-like protein
MGASQAYNEAIALAAELKDHATRDFLQEYSER